MQNRQKFAVISILLLVLKLFLPKTIKVMHNGDPFFVGMNFSPPKLLNGFQ